MYHNYNPSLSDWVSVLSIATRFGFQRVRERAIIEIESSRFQRELGPVQKIVWAEKYDVHKWFFACYEALCQRDAGLKDSEAEALGPMKTNRIWKAREAVRRDGSRNYSEMPSTESPTDWDIKTYNMQMVSNVVEEVFLLSLAPPMDLLDLPEEGFPPSSVAPPEASCTVFPTMKQSKGKKKGDRRKLPEVG
jgi:hypothetical protein